MSQQPPAPPRIDIASLLHRQVDVVVAGAAPEMAAPAHAAAPATTIDTGHRQAGPEPAWASAPADEADPEPPHAPAVPSQAAGHHGEPATAAMPATSADPWQAAFAQRERERAAAAGVAGAEGEPAASADSAAGSAAAPLPGFLRRQVQRPATWWQWALAIVLGLGLALQVLLADRERLAANPNLRPLLTTLCTQLGCRLPLWHQPEAITLVQRSVTPLPGHPGVLEIQATLRNDARWAQALPAIELTLSNADGQVSGQHIFLPADYLPQAATIPLQPGKQVQVRWLVREPDSAADAFNFRFR